MDLLDLPPGHALVVYTRMPASSLKSTTRVRYGRRCSIRSYDMTPIEMPGVSLAARPRAYAYAEGDLAPQLSKAARSGAFTAVIANPHARRAVITAIVDHDRAVATARKARMRAEDAEWEAQAPRGREDRAASED